MLIAQVENTFSGWSLSLSIIQDISNPKFYKIEMRLHFSFSDTPKKMTYKYDALSSYLLNDVSFY